MKKLDFKGALNNLEVLHSINGKINRVKYQGGLFANKVSNRTLLVRLGLGVYLKTYRIELRRHLVKIGIIEGI